MTPETGRVFFQAAFAPFTPGSPTRVDFANARRAPLLLIAGDKDHIVPAALSRRNYRKYARSGAVTEYREFPGRTHWIIAQDGWREVAEHIDGWFSTLVPGAPNS